MTSYTGYFHIGAVVGFDCLWDCANHFLENNNFTQYAVNADALISMAGNKMFTFQLKSHQYEHIRNVAAAYFDSTKVKMVIFSSFKFTDRNKYYLLFLVKCSLSMILFV